MTQVYRWTSEEHSHLLSGCTENTPESVTVTLTQETLDNIEHVRNVLSNLIDELNGAEVDYIPLSIDCAEFEGFDCSLAKKPEILVGKDWMALAFTLEWCGSTYEITLDKDTLVG